MITYQLEQNLYVNITNRCPNRCAFCVRNRKKGLGDAASLWLEQEPSKEEILADIERRDLNQYNELVFCGYGEPFERFDDMVWVLQKIRGGTPIPVRINTNGLGDLINQKPTIPPLRGLVDALSVSLNASNADDYDALCRSRYGKAAFDAVLAFTKEAAEIIPSVTLSVLDTLPAEEIERCRVIAKQCNAALKIRELIDSACS